MDDPVVVATFHYRHEAEFARGILEDRGIGSVLDVDDAGGSYVGMSFSNPARLVVRASDRERARTALIQAGVLRNDE